MFNYGGSFAEEVWGMVYIGVAKGARLGEKALLNSRSIVVHV